jgi:hypothetical protein
MRYDIARLVGGVSHFFAGATFFNHLGNFNWCRAGGGAAIARALPAAETIGAVEAAPQFAAILCGPSLAPASRVKIAARSSNSSAHTRSCSLATLVRAPAINSRQRRAKSWSVSGFKKRPPAPVQKETRCFESPAVGSRDPHLSQPKQVYFIQLSILLSSDYYNAKKDRCVSTSGSAAESLYDMLIPPSALLQGLRTHTLSLPTKATPFRGACEAFWHGN